MILYVKKKPYSAPRYKEFNVFLLLSFAMVFGWCMQFKVIEWEVYSLTKNPLSIGIIGLLEVRPAILIALFAWYIVDQKEKKGLLFKWILGFSIISLGLFWFTWPHFIKDFSTQTILYSIYFFVFSGELVRAFLGPTIFSLLAFIVPKKEYPNAAIWSSSVWQISSFLSLQ